MPEKTGGKILREFIICHGSPLHKQQIQQINWAGDCLLVAVKRNGTELIPKGKTMLQAGDVLVTLTDEAHAAPVYDYMKKMCAEKESLHS